MLYLDVRHDSGSRFELLEGMRGLVVQREPGAHVSIMEMDGKNPKLHCIYVFS